MAQRLIHYFAALPSRAAALAFPEPPEREREILCLFAQGYSNVEIANELVPSLETVQNYVSNIWGKLQVADRMRAVLGAREGVRTWVIVHLTLVACLHDDVLQMKGIDWIVAQCDDSSSKVSYPLIDSPVYLHDPGIVEMTITNRSLGIGVIGTGGMGGRHARNVHRRIVGAHVAGLFDVDAKKVTALSAECNSAQVFASPEELIHHETVDAVIIASPNHTHAPFTLHCLKAGKPVLCEKPLATSAAEAWEVVDAEVAIGRKLVMVGFMRRFDPSHLAVMEAVRAGRIGRPYLYKGVHRNQRVPVDFPGEDVINQSAVHDIDATRWLLGREVEEVYARGVRVDQALDANTADLVLLTMSLSDGALSTVEVFLSARYGYEVTAEIVGDRGVVTTQQPEGVHLRAGNARFAHIPEDWLARFQDAYVAEVQEWIDALKHAAHIGATAWDGYVSLLVCDASVTSLKMGESVPVTSHPEPSLYL